MKSGKSARNIPIIAALWLVWALPNGWSAPLAQGDKAPDLKSYELLGQLPATLQDKVVLLDFWASWCAPCKQSFPVMERLHQRYGKRGLVVIAVNVDEDAAEMQKFLRDRDVSFLIVRDARQKLVERCAIQTMPTSFLIDRSGVVKSVLNGFHKEKSEQELESQIQELLK